LNSRPRIGLLTGTFDPVHLGHLAMAKAAMAKFDLVEVWFLVNPVPEHKALVTDLDLRVSMVRLALEGQANLRVGEPSAIRAVRHRMPDFVDLMARHSDADFIFIVGLEVLDGLKSWDQHESVAAQVRFAVAQRPGRAHPVILDSRLQVQWFDLKEYSDASSGRVRADLERNVKPPELDSKVFMFILEHGLYR
jgi:nicotinate-nucleotide adenylyltransferase